jgi:cell division septal protein FtsQ
MKLQFKKRLQRKIALNRDKILHSKRQLLWWLSTLAVIAIYTIIIVGPIFRLKNITCQVFPKGVCPDFVIPEMNRYLNHHLFTLPSKHIKQRLAANLPHIQTITLTPKWPDQLVIELSKHPTSAYLQVPASESAYTVSSRGTIMDLVSTPDQEVPVIVASSAADLIISDQITEPSILSALEIINLLKNSRFELESIDVRSPYDIRGRLKQDLWLGFTTTKSISDQVNSLHLITSQTTIDYEGQIIDLRYDRPAIKSMW